MKTGLIIGLVILALVVVGAFFYLNSYNSGNGGVVCAQDVQQCPDGSYVSRVAPSCKFADCPVISGSNNSSQQASPETLNIEISDFAFKQSQLTINIGDTVIWTNKDSASHTVTSDSGSELNSPSLSRNQMYSHTFNQQGTFEYHCKPHSYMEGKIIVGRVK